MAVEIVSSMSKINISQDFTVRFTDIILSTNKYKFPFSDIVIIERENKKQDLFKILERTCTLV